MSGKHPQAGPSAARSEQPREIRVALDALRHIVQALRGGRARGAMRLGSAQLFALQQIAEHPNASINEVAALTFTHQSSVSVVVRSLVRLRLVAKVPSPADRRRQRLAVTAQGLSRLRQAPVAAQERLIAAIAALPPADRRNLGRSLNTIARSVAPANAGAPPPMFFESESPTSVGARRSSGIAAMSRHRRDSNVQRRGKRTS